MELQGETLIAAPPLAVWAALNDPEVLARCIEGVETLTRIPGDNGEDRFEGKMNAKVGPVRATFAGSVRLTELDPPHRYVLVGEGKGGVAGFAKGQAEVVLTPETVDDRDGTRLAYRVTSSVGGKLAQLGARLIEGTAKGYAETFFTRFKAEVETPVGQAFNTVMLDANDEIGLGTRAAALGEPLPADLPAPLGAPSPATGGLPPVVWGGMLVLLVLALLYWQLA